VDAAAAMESPQDVVRVLAALSDLNRYRIVELLCVDGAELSCRALAGVLGLSPSLLSHHLGVLEAAGVIERRRDGFCTLNRLRRSELSRRLSGLQRLITPAASAHGAGTH
jgi:ArsR family transcriptional regulator, lead/cadmium/zinc/bismuth-responsive transcriptional repressor